MVGLRNTFRRIGTIGTLFLVSLLFFVLFYLTGHPLLLALDLFLLFPTGAIATFRGARFVYRESLWSVRNRLLCVYTLFGVLPVFLLFILFAITAWALVSELAIYLATSALERRVESVNTVIPTIQHIPAQYRREALQEIEASYRKWFPRFDVYIKDSQGVFKSPPDAPDVEVSPKWGDTGGLIVMRKRFYAWAHAIDNNQEITVLAPLSDQIIAELVPHLGIIALVEGPSPGNEATVSTGAVKFEVTPDRDENPTFPETGHLPPAMSRLDIPVALPSTVAHYHLNEPGKVHQSLLWVRSRPSAVMRAFFSDTDLFRGILSDVLIGVAVLFLLVELGAVILGVSLSARITRAVNQIYEGTRRVIRGDFAHRIPIASHDQLGELAASFNQMTGNLERLLVVEKERERLQAEIEIAREVQRQLYPQGDPPRSRLHLTARCDPARMVSGDYYDYQMIGKSKLAFAIGDVAGKGISAALLMATIQAALRAQVSHTQPLIENQCGIAPDVDSALLVSKLNRQVWEHTSPEKYATFFFAAYDEPNSTLTYTNAGHLPPLLFRNGNVVPLDTNGTVVGAFPNALYDASCINIDPGDLLVCYTDGITEPENAYGEMFGEERLIELVQRHGKSDDQEIIRLVFEAVRTWTGVGELHDDMTLLLARNRGN
jgi:sigma-B regulation protein RsbU (phosphoserine phosphatase)